MTDRAPAEQAAEALRKAKKSLGEWTPRYHFIDDALREIDIALAALTAEAGGATTEEGGDSNKRRNRESQEASTPGRDKSAPALGSGPERATDEIIGDAIAKAHCAPWEPVAFSVPWADLDAREKLARRLLYYAGNEVDPEVQGDLRDAAAIVRLPASPDREALARRLDEMRTVRPPLFIDEKYSTLLDDLAAFLRAPAQAEVEALVGELLFVRAALFENADVTQYERVDAAIDFLRHLSLSPAVGAGWRPTETESIADLQAELARVQSKLARRVLGDPAIGVGSQPLPLPPAPEEAK